MKIIKFNNELSGYGFDLPADRVLRFNKHPDGTYLNSRVIYDINKKAYSHIDLRNLALEKFETKSNNNNIKWKWIIGLCLIIVLLSKCSIDFTIDVTEKQNSYIT